MKNIVNRLGNLPTTKIIGWVINTLAVILGLVIIVAMVKNLPHMLAIAKEAIIVVLNHQDGLVLLVMAIVAGAIMRRCFSPRAVLITLTSFLIYVFLMARVKEAGVLEGYEGISFLLEAPLNFFDWLGSLVKKVLEAPQEFCEGVIGAVKNFAGKLLGADSLENVLQILKTEVLDKLFDLFREILDIEEKCGTQIGREGWKAFTEVYPK